MPRHRFVFDLSQPAYPAGEPLDWRPKLLSGQAPWVERELERLSGFDRKEFLLAVGQRRPTS